MTTGSGNCFHTVYARGEEKCITLYCPTVKRFSPRVMPLANSVT